MSIHQATADKQVEHYRPEIPPMQFSSSLPRTRDTELKHASNRKGKFITIDNTLDLARELLLDLTQLSEYRYPLSVRKGVSVITPEEKKESKTVKAGARTYFFDIQKTKKDKSYLTITESRYKGEGEDRERSTIAVFPERIEEFAKALGVGG